MKSLVCVVIGDGGVFVVEIDERKKVGVLKKMIKEGNSANIQCDEKDLTLYLAKKGDEYDARIERRAVSREMVRRQQILVDKLVQFSTAHALQPKCRSSMPQSTVKPNKPSVFSKLK
ncbi:hypothetical protein V7S43_018427 [Phytophthora oleae]|uniref:Crinkler effector protein N-terminal domain-containing protein n=1 Tax=Phytophthora oleae TaxID=2107226 RepID=A0ABD3EQE7_9STRA